MNEIETCLTALLYYGKFPLDLPYILVLWACYINFMPSHDVCKKINFNQIKLEIIRAKCMRA